MDTEDAVRETMLRVVRYAGGHDPERSSVEPWWQVVRGPCGVGVTLPGWRTRRPHTTCR